MTLFLQILNVALVFIGVCVVTSVRTRIKTMSAALDRLTTEVTENTSTIASAKALIAGLAQQIRDASGNEDKLNKLADDLDSSSNDLASAVTENTPAADEPAPTEEPTA